MSRLTVKAVVEFLRELADDARSGAGCSHEDALQSSLESIAEEAENKAKEWEDDKTDLPDLKIQWRVSMKPNKEYDKLHPADLEMYRDRPPLWLGDHYTEDEALDAFHAEVPIKRLEDFEIEIKSCIDQELVLAYFESDSHAEPAAIFYGEEIYQACLPALEALADEHRMEVTESVRGTNHDLFKIIEELDDDQ